MLFSILAQTTKWIALTLVRVAAVSTAVKVATVAGGETLWQLSSKLSRIRDSHLEDEEDFTIIDRMFCAFLSAMQTMCSITGNALLRLSGASQGPVVAAY